MVNAIFAGNQTNNEASVTIMDELTHKKLRKGKSTEGLIQTPWQDLKEGQKFFLICIGKQLAPYAYGPFIVIDKTKAIIKNPRNDISWSLLDLSGLVFAIEED